MPAPMQNNPLLSGLRKHSPSDTLIFLHIKKTAGSTLKFILRNQFHPRTILTIHNNTLVKDFNDILYKDFLDLPAERKQNIRFMRGHFAFGIHEYLPHPFTYLTMLRDPIERAISWYYYFKENPHSQEYKNYVSQSAGFEDFINKGYCGDNTQTIMLLSKKQLDDYPDDKDRVEIALQNIENNFSHFGFAEKFDESLILMKKTYNWKYLPLYTVENVTKNRPRASELPTSVTDAILEHNRADVTLYEKLSAKFKLQLAADEVSIRDEVKKLRLLNNALKYSVELSAGKQFDQALSLLNQCRQIDPSSPHIYKEMGKIHLQLMDITSAVQSFLQAIELNPYDTETIAFVSVLLTKLGKHSQAQDLQKLL